MRLFAQHTMFVIAAFAVSFLVAFALVRVWTLAGGLP